MRSRPCGESWHEHLRGGSPVADRRMRPDSVVVPPPALDDDLGLAQGVEDLAVKQLVAQPGIKTLDEPVLPRAAGVGPITALSVASAFDQASRFKRSSSAGAYLGLTPKRYESKVLCPESVGVATCQEGRLQESSCRGRPKVGRCSSRHVENKHAVPLELGCCLIGTRSHSGGEAETLLESITKIGV